MEQTILGVFTIKKEGAEPTDDLEDVGIIMEGVEVLHDLGNIANAVAILFGLVGLELPNKAKVHIWGSTNSCDGTGWQPPLNKGSSAKK